MIELIENNNINSIVEKSQKNINIYLVLGKKREYKEIDLVGRFFRLRSDR